MSSFQSMFRPVITVPSSPTYKERVQAVAGGDAAKARMTDEIAARRNCSGV